MDEHMDAQDQTKVLPPLEGGNKLVLYMCLMSLLLHHLYYKFLVQVIFFSFTLPINYTLWAYARVLFYPISLLFCEMWLSVWLKSLEFYLDFVSQINLRPMAT